MPKNGTILSVTSAFNGKKTTTALPCINPDTSNSDLKKFVRGYNSLSASTIKSVQKMQLSDLDISQNDD